jgi:hypothetical protein
MSRTITQITTEIKASFVAESELANTYGLDQAKTFDEQFSRVSIETLMIYIVGLAIWTLEKIVDAFSIEVDSRIEAAYITSLRWYHAAALAYQAGDVLTYNPLTYKVGYALIDETKKILKFAAVKEVIPTSSSERTILQIKVSKANKQALTAEELAPFKSYMQCVGAAGMAYEITSGVPVAVAFNLSIVRDPLLLGDTVAGRASIASAISTYLDNLDYGGEISTSGVITAVMGVAGVKDMRYNHAIITAANVDDVRIDSVTGAFILDNVNMVITMS